jgi:LPPG:FO 2-phospho-L-lactate transferase
MARALAGVLSPANLEVIVNVGDDAFVHGAYVAADLDTVMYTLAEIEGEHGWGRAGDSWTVMDEMVRLGSDPAFRLGDLDLATCLRRTAQLAAGRPLSAITTELAAAHGVEPRLRPATDDRVRTRVQIGDGTWLDFQDYFVVRGHADTVIDIDYVGADAAAPGPGVLDAIAAADVVVIAPSNPPLSIWPILAIPGVREAVARATVVAVSPLFGGEALKGPAADVMRSLGLPPGNAGVLEAYRDLLDVLVVDAGDAADVTELANRGPQIVALDTRITEADAAARFGNEVTSIIAALTSERPVR